MAKKVTGYVNLQAEAGKANPSSMGNALGPKGINIMDFCRAFNEQTKNFEPGTPVPVCIEIYQDRTFTFTTSTPPASYYLKKAAKIKKGSTATGRMAAVATISEEDCRKIAQEKMKDLNAYDEEAAIQMIKGTAKSIGIKVQ